MADIAANLNRLSPLQRALFALKETRAQLEAVERARTEPIAIIGMGCRFPGGANDPEAFWRLLRDGVDTVTEVPPDRWDIEAYYDPNPEAPGKMYTRYSAFVEGVDQFDPHFFGIAPREAVAMDPQQRLLLEVSWEALEYAGQAPDKLAGSRTGVFVGISTNDYLQLQMKGSDVARIDAYVGTGNAFSVASGRLSYLLGLQGPSMAVDTACSSSLVAVHLACQSLRANECHLALAGGVNVILSPETTINFSKARMMAADGRCKTFDAAADGYVRGEGCGIVVLKRLVDAVADGDRILALIRGSAVNQDGRSGGLTAPNGPAQEAVIGDALANARVEPAQVSYVEMHGTGTALGDPIEVRALARALGKRQAQDQPVAIGSVKTNVGHLEAAAGVAGLMKVILALQHGEIPPHLHLHERNPYIAWDDMPVVIPTTRTPWLTIQGRRIAGVSAFGFSGTNAHVVLEQAPAQEVLPTVVDRPVHLLSLSAQSAGALQELTQRYGQSLRVHADAALADVAYTANTGRTHWPHRLAAVASSTAQLSVRLQAWAAGQAPAGVQHGVVRGPQPPPVVFLFTGQGAQYVGMGQQLYATEPRFRQVLEQCDALLRPQLARPLLEVLYPAPGTPTPLDETAYTQPALFALEYALAELWRSWGIEPAAVLGHSVGEYVAACVAGVLSWEDGLRLVAERGRLMQALPPAGAMAAVFAAAERVEAYVAPEVGEVALAAINGPSECVVAGEGAAVQRVCAALAAAGVTTRRLRVSHAFHSPLIEPMLAAFAAVAVAVPYVAPRLDVVTNLTGRVAQGGEVRSAAYWCAQARSTVRFAAGMETLYAQGYRVFVEVGPQPTLLGLGRRCVPEAETVWLPSLRAGQDAWPQLLESLGGLYTQGVAVDWPDVDRAYARRKVALPTYPFQRQRYWVVSGTPGQGQVTAGAEPEGVELHCQPTGPDVSQQEQALALLQRLQTASPPARRTLLLTRMQEEVAHVLGLDPSHAPLPQQSFFEMGMDSLMAVELRSRLEACLGRPLSSTLAFDYPTLDTLAGYLLRDVLALETPAQPTRVRSTSQALEECIAVIGLGCRFPGGANNPAAFWRLVHEGVDAITKVPADRWNVDDFYDPDPTVPRKMYTRHGGFLDGPVDQFDAHFFGIAPREAVSMDPQQRLLLEVAWEALEDAGQPLERLTASQTGVFVGINTNDYMQLISANNSTSIDAYVATGNTFSVAAGRLSYFLGLQGPSLAVDTACSSSLVTIHLACQSLRLGECDLALAGGVNLMLSPATTIGMAKLRALSPDGRCKTFDAAADGYGRGEGCGMVVLKRLTDAVADGDPILAIVRGSAVNQDGSSGGLTVPNGPAQQALLRETLAAARVAPSEVRYVEVHGTGTPLGDPIELQALGAVLGQERAADQPLIVGSVKTNFGHLEAAAGVAGFIKIVLALQHQEIPPHLHLHEPNPYIPWDALPVQVPTECMPWIAGQGRRIAGISSFGFSGTNAHIIVEEAPVSVLTLEKAEPTRPPEYLLPLSARSPEALRALAQAYQTFLADSAPGANVPFADICYTASVRRSHHEQRLALVAHSPAACGEQLQAFLRGEGCPMLSTGHHVAGQRPKLVFVFPGQGAQWFGMGRQLLAQEPVFRAALEQCDQAMQPYMERSVLAELTADEADACLDRIDVVQPVLCALQIALAALWQAWGIAPDAVVGHSMGEVAAAHVAGALSLDAAARVICHRSRLMRRVSGQGAMVVAALSLAQAQDILLGYEERLSIAVSNGPMSTGLSGETAALQEVMDTLRHQNVFCQWVKTDVAFHSHQMDPLRTELVQLLAELQPQPASRPIYATVTGHVSDGLAFDAVYWGRNLREPVFFFPTMQQVLEDGYDVFIESSPHPILTLAMAETMRHFSSQGTVLPSLRRGEAERAVMLESLGTLYTRGYPIDWPKLYPTTRHCTPLPSYPWQRRRYWFQTAQAEAGADRQRAWMSRDGTGHPLLERSFKSAAGERFWEVDLNTQVLPYLEEFRIQGAVLLPTSIYVEMALAVAAEAFGDGLHILEKFSVHRPLILLEQDCRTLQVILTPAEAPQIPFQIFSFAADTDKKMDAILHATGFIVVGQSGTTQASAETLVLAEVQARCCEEMDGETLYQRLADAGLQMGKGVGSLEKLWRQEGEVLGAMRLSETFEPAREGYWMHPALLETCFQLFTATLPEMTELYQPVGLAGFRIVGRPGTQLWAHARLLRQEASYCEGEMRLVDASGRIVAEACGLRFQRLDRAALRHAMWARLRDCLYELQWQPQLRPESVQRQPDEPGSWLIFADAGGVGAALAQHLEAHDQHCVLVFPGVVFAALSAGQWQINPANTADISRLLDATMTPEVPPCRGLIHLWSLDVPPQEAITCETLERMQVIQCGSVLSLIQALVKTTEPVQPHLWLVSRGVQSVGAEPAPPALVQAPLWGLGRVIALEHPEIWGGVIDMDPCASVQDAETLFEEIWTLDDEDQLAYRAGQRHVARLVRRDSLDLSSQPVRLQSDATYLITGGVGALGLKVASWMVEQGARHLILTSRRGLPERSTWGALPPDTEVAHHIAAVRALEERGATVHVRPADSADVAQMAAVCAPLGSTQPPLRGVVHAAGVFVPQLLREMTYEEFQSVLRPKVEGTWVLHQLTQDMDLDFFVLFSSAASVWGSGLAAHYVAANHFQDIFAHYRHALGLPALTINWGWWADSGMVAADIRAYFDAMGLHMLSQDQGLSALEYLLAGAVVQQTVAPVDWQKFKLVFEARRRRHLLDLIEVTTPEQSRTTSTAGGQLLRQLMEIPASERLAVVVAYVQGEVAQVLGLDVPDALEPQQGFFKIGMDSLSSVEFKIRLEASLGLTLPATVAFEYPTIAALAGYLLEQALASSLSASMDAAASGESNKPDEAAALEELSEHELIALLADELGKLDEGRSA